MPPPNNPWLNQVLPSGVLDALSNNDPPKQNVVRAAKAFRENPALFSSVVDKRIDELDKQINILQQERSQLSNKVNIRLAIEETYTTICAPFRTIPRDILREIAHHCSHPHPSPARKRAPLSLTHVSSRWRSVVTSSPAFWTTLYILIKKADYDSLAKHLKVIQTWFRRAGSLPIQLFLHVSCELGPADNTAYNFRMFLKALAPWAPRISHLGIGGSHWVNLITAFVEIKWDLSLLGRLDFKGSLGQFGGRSRGPMDELASICTEITLFRNAKCLTTLVASLELFSYIRSFAFVPWGQIQHLTLVEYQASSSHQFAMLKQCPQLQTASLCWSEYCALTPETEPYSLEKLEKLHLDDVRLYDPNQLVIFFSKILFPSLTHLHISIHDLTLDPDDSTAMLDPIPLLPSLQFFAIMDGNDGLPFHLIQEFLRKMPRLRTFKMEVTGDHDEEHRTDLNKLCNSLTIRAGYCEYLPLLEECSFFGEYEPSYLVDVNLVAQFIQSRTHNIPPGFSSLQRVTFRGDWGFMTGLREEVMRLSSAGLSVEINIQCDGLDGEPSFRHPFGLQSNSFSNAAHPSAHYCAEFNP